MGPDVTTLAWVRAALASDAELVRAGGWLDVDTEAKRIIRGYVILDL